MIGRCGAAAALMVAAAAPAWAPAVGAGDAAGAPGAGATIRPASPWPGATAARQVPRSTAAVDAAAALPIIPAAPDVFDARAFARGRARLVGGPSPMPGARAVVVPHHWPAGALIAAGLRDLAATRRIRRVVLIGPDHAHAGAAPATTAAGGGTRRSGRWRATRRRSTGWPRRAWCGATRG